MQYFSSILSVIYQMFTLLLLVLAQSYYYSDMEFNTLKKLISHKLLISLLVGIMMSIMYYFNISHYFTVFIIIWALTIMYVGIGNVLFIYFFVVIGNILFDFNIKLLFAYFVMIIISYLMLKWIKNYYFRLFIAYFLSFIFLNIEIYISHLRLGDYLIYNLSCFIVWSILIYLIIYYVKKYKNLLESQQIAFTDKRTNTLNYYCLVNHSYRLLKDKKMNISVILINIDRLKDINALYGDFCGDKAIKIVSESIKEIIDDYGTVYRLDGDTFCVIAIDEKLKLLQTLVERIRLDIELKDIIVENNKINLSVSIGGYYGKIDSRNIDDYIELANSSLFKSKYQGRNRVIINNQMVYYPKIM